MPGRSSVSSRDINAFTLVELLVVIAIIGALVALLLPAVQSAREAARRNSCVNNLKQLGLAVQTYHDVRGTFPQGRLSTNQEGFSWAFRLLPYLEQESLFDSYNGSVPVFDDLNAQAMRTPVETFVCPSRRTPEADRDFDNNDATPVVSSAGAGGDYAANAGLSFLYGTPNANVLEDEDPTLVAGPIHTFSRVKARQVTDGLSHTFAVGEKFIPQDLDVPSEQEDQFSGDTAYFAADRPSTIFAGTEQGLGSGYEDKSDMKFGSEHPDIVQFVYLDGHVSALDLSVDQDTLEHLSTIADGEVIDTARL
ncbi:MAG: DUF1559 domain-containing protein [Planctomycetota bacterium]